VLKQDQKQVFDLFTLLKKSSYVRFEAFSHINPDPDTFLKNMYRIGNIPVSCCHTRSSSMLPAAPTVSACRPVALPVTAAAFLRLLLRGSVWEPGRFSGDKEEGKGDCACSVGLRGRVLKKGQSFFSDTLSAFFSAKYLFIGTLLYSN
jgi:hypothetical protein